MVFVGYVFEKSVILIAEIVLLFERLFSDTIVVKSDVKTLNSG